jgi:hypothetical protein
MENFMCAVNTKIFNDTKGEIMLGNLLVILFFGILSCSDVNMKDRKNDMTPKANQPVQVEPNSDQVEPNSDQGDPLNEADDIQKEPPLDAAADPKSTHASHSTVKSFIMKKAYKASNGRDYDIIGFEPAQSDSKGYPLYIFVNGTTMNHDRPEVKETLEEVAKRGFVAAAVQYDNNIITLPGSTTTPVEPFPYPINCEQFLAKAKCMYSGPASALGVLCNRNSVDCDKGIVTHGMSQGSKLSILANNFDPRIKATLADSSGDEVWLIKEIYGYRSCLDDGNRTLPSNRLRMVSGEFDIILSNGTAEGVRGIGNRLLGDNCNKNNCLKPDGSGFYIITNKELGDGTADHCWMINGGCLSKKGADTKYYTDDGPWARKASVFDWLLGMGRK